jgi:magnesium transporter
MTVIDNAVYVDRYRTADPEGLEETYFVLRQADFVGTGWTTCCG